METKRPFILSSTAFEVYLQLESNWNPPDFDPIDPVVVSVPLDRIDAIDCDTLDYEAEMHRLGAIIRP